mmetsp:Transcript_12179/g.13884  ORF Transcript_12179/g.13884 Transcript_12179/m.13884 type:complete len:265 (-) Transcript_12179:14-808(-)
MVSASFFSSMVSLFWASLSLDSSASLTILSMSESESPPELLMVMLVALPVSFSLADTLTIPDASMSKLTSICGWPRGAMGMPPSSNSPKSLLSAAISLSPWKTLIPTLVWLSAAVENTCDFLVGIVVFLWINLVKTPPKVSIPRERGVTSRRSTSLTSPVSTAPWMAAPIATASSGFTLLLAAFPKNFLTVSSTFGILVIPPTSRISSILLLSIPESLMQFSRGLIVLVMRSSTSDSYFALVMDSCKCLGPVESAERYGRVTSV